MIAYLIRRPASVAARLTGPAALLECMLIPAALAAAGNPDTNIALIIADPLIADPRTRLC